ARVNDLIQLRRHGDAKVMVEGYLAEHPEDADGWGYHALALLPSDPAAALRSAEGAVGLDPDRVWLHRVVAQAAGEAGNRHLAVVAAEHAVALDPHDPRSQRLLV